LNPNAVGSKGLGHLIVPDGPEFTTDGLPKSFLMLGDDNPPGQIIGEEYDEAYVLPGCAFEFRYREADRTVSRDEDDGAVGVEEASGHGARDSPADNSAGTAGQPVAGVPVAEELVCPLADVAAIDQDHGIICKDGLDRPHDVHGVEFLTGAFSGV
jgi:hypothetical protein